MVPEININEQTKELSNTGELQRLFEASQQQLGEKILGQKHLTDRLLIALLSDGHLLVEGHRGLPKPGR